MEEKIKDFEFPENLIIFSTISNHKRGLSIPTLFYFFDMDFIFQFLKKNSFLPKWFLKNGPIQFRTLLEFLTFSKFRWHPKVQKVKQYRQGSLVMERWIVSYKLNQLEHLLSSPLHALIWGVKKVLFVNFRTFLRIDNILRYPDRIINYWVSF